MTRPFYNFATISVAVTPVIIQEHHAYVRSVGTADVFIEG